MSENTKQDASDEIAIKNANVVVLDTQVPASKQGIRNLITNATTPSPDPTQVELSWQMVAPKFVELYKSKAKQVGAKAEEKPVNVGIFKHWRA